MHSHLLAKGCIWAQETRTLFNQKTDAFQIQIIEVTWLTRRAKKVLPNKPSRMTQAKEAMKNALDANNFIVRMKTNAETEIMKTSMVLPKIRHSLELTQALAGKDLM